MFEDQFGERYVRPGMPPLLTQVTEHCSTTRIMSAVFEPGIGFPPYRLQ
jgi:hypothetical protein